MFQYHVQVVVAGVVVTKALCWTDLVPVFGILLTDFGPGCYDHLNYNHLSAVHNVARQEYDLLEYYDMIQCRPAIV